MVGPDGESAPIVREIARKLNAGKYVLIKGKQVISVSDTQNDAIRVGIDKFGNTPFLVKKIEEIESRQNFTSNLIRVKQHAVGNC